MTNVLITGDLTLVGSQNALTQTRSAAILSDVKSTGTDAGGSSATTTQDRTLNTLDDPDGLITLDGGNVLFSFNYTGTYLLQGKVPGYKCGTSKMFITDSSNSVQLLGISTNEIHSTVNVQINSHLSGILTVTSTSTQYKVRQYTSATEATDGLGHSSGSGTNEIYTVLRIIKLS